MCLNCGLYLTSWCLVSLVRRNSSMRDMASPSYRAGMQNHHPKNRKQVWAKFQFRIFVHYYQSKDFYLTFIRFSDKGCQTWYEKSQKLHLELCIILISINMVSHSYTLTCKFCLAPMFGNFNLIRDWTVH